MSSLESLGGALGKEQLFSLLGYLKNTSSTGRLMLESSARHGSIFIRDGEVVHAEVGDLSGERAMLHMFTWNEGLFSFRSNETSIKQTIVDSLESLALAVAVAIDHGTNHEPGLEIDITLAARSKPQAANAQFVLEGNELMLLSRIHSSISLEVIAQELGWDILQLRAIVRSLIDRQMIELIEPVRRASVDPAFIGSLRQVYADVLGPAANFLFDDVAAALSIDTRSMRPNSFSDFLRGLANAIDDPNAQRYFIERLKQLRAQHGI